MLAHVLQLLSFWLPSSSLIGMRRAHILFYRTRGDSAPICYAWNIDQLPRLRVQQQPPNIYGLASVTLGVYV